MMIMTSSTDLEQRISAIEKRNRTVELNKAWEQSYTRRLLIVLFTYISIATYLKYIVGIDPWINAIVPALGFLLSTLTLPFFKRLWQKHFYNSLV